MTPRVLVLGLILTLVSACGQQVAGEAKAANNAVQATPRKTAPPSRPVKTTTTRPSTRPSGKPEVSDLAGVWEGEYTCGQGNTGLTLTIKAPKDGELPATFEFFPLASNPSAKKGSYTMIGSLSPSGQLVFNQREWVDQPPGYMMVDLAVTSPIDSDTTTLSGDVLDPSCKGFSVRRR